MTDTLTRIETPDYAAIKTKQQAAWTAGDYSAVGVTLQIVAENLCEEMKLHAGQDVLDVAAGNGACSLAAAHRMCNVTSTDYVEELLERGEARAKAEGLAMTFQKADAEDLPFAKDTYDAVVSTFGAMFAPDQQTVANELLRVCKPGGKVGMANWTPDSFIGRLFKVIGSHVTGPKGLNPPSRWGSNDGLGELFAGAASVTANRRIFNFLHHSPEQWVESWRVIYGPLHKAFAQLDAEGQDAFAADLVALINEMNLARDGTMFVPSAYLEVIVTK
ncbi:MAG: class I SAM-dependent methyltransferase [Pseudomonadota bacterium]